MKAVEVTDLNVKYVNLTKGKYLIDGEVVGVTGHNSSKVAVKDFDNIRKIEDKTVVAYYLCGDKKLSVEDYITQELKLTAKRKVVVDSYDDEEDIVWDSLEDEFEYKRFKKMWTQVTTTIQEISEPLLFEVEKRQVETGNPYITSEFQMGSDSDMFVYNQGLAYAGLLKEIMEELGMTFKGKLDYQHTKIEKVWGNSEHSNIEFVTAFGGYLFSGNKRFTKYYNSRGTLESCIAKYNNDREELRTYVKNAYNAHFGWVDAKEFDFKGLLEILKQLDRLVIYGDYKKAGQYSYSVIKNKLRDAIEKVQISFKEDI